MTMAEEASSSGVSTTASTTATMQEEEINRMKAKMSSEANKVVRERYRNLLITQQEKVDSAGEAGLPVEELRKMVLEANDAFSEVHRPREAALDAEFLKTCGLLVKSNIENKQYNTMKFLPAEYARKMIEFMKGENETQVDLLDSTIWKRFGRAVSSIYINTPSLETAYPGFNVTIQKKERQRRKLEKEEVGARAVPKLVESSNEEERQTEELNRIHKVLRRRYQENQNKPICFFRFVINPDSYSYTIENLFHTSFLVNSCRAQILTDENELPVIMPMDAKVSKGSSSEVSNCQCLISLSTEEFREAITTFKIRESCIPPPQNRKKRSLV